MGDVTGDWNVEGTGKIIIGGSVTSTASLTVRVLQEDFLIIDGNVDGPVTINEGLIAGPASPANLTIGGDLNAPLTIGYFDDNVYVQIDGDCNADASFGLALQGNENTSIIIGGALADDATLDFTNFPLAGALEVRGGGGGDILGLIQVEPSGSIVLGTEADDTFSGTLTVSQFVYGMAGTLTVENLAGTITLFTLTGPVDIRGSLLSDAALGIRLWGGDVSINSAERVSAVAEGAITNYQQFPQFPASFTGSLTIFDDGAGGGGDFDGSLLVQGANGISTTGVITIDGNLGGSITFEDASADLAGTISVQGSGLSTGDILVKDEITADADITFAGELCGQVIADSDSSGVGDLDGQVTIDGEFNGNICGANLDPADALPANIDIADFGPNGRICGAAPGCPVATILASDPYDGIVDARQPHEPSSTLPRQGIGSPDDGNGDLSIEPVTIDIGVGGADTSCFVLCETEEDTLLGANSVASVTDNSDGTYTLFLDHAIVAGAVTTISYLGGASYVEFIAHPANVDGEGTSGSADLLRLIDDINGTTTPVHGDYSNDIDHSGQVASADLLRLIDLLNGAGEYDSWNGVSFPVNETCPPSIECGTEGAGGGDSFAPSDGDSSDDATSGDDNAMVADWFVNYLSTAAPSGTEEEAQFDLFAGALAQWCLDYFTDTEQTDLADRLSDPELTFAGDYAAAVAEDVVKLLAP